jgi:hypothetical protein
MLRKLLIITAHVTMACGVVISLVLFSTLLVGFFAGTRQETMMAVLVLFVFSLLLALYGKILDIHLD